MTKVSRPYTEGKTIFSIKDVESTGYPHRKICIWTSPYSIHKNNFQMTCRSKCKRQKIMLLEENIGEYFHDLGMCKDFLNMVQKSSNPIEKKSINWNTLKLRTAFH